MQAGGITIALPLPSLGNAQDSADQQACRPAPRHCRHELRKALKELESIVGRLERGDVELEESIIIYERGEALKDHCDRLLKQAEAKVERLTFSETGTPVGTEPSDPARVAGASGATSLLETAWDLLYSCANAAPVALAGPWGRTLPRPGPEAEY